MSATHQEVTPVSLGFVNCFIVRGDDRIVLVDTGTPGKERAILSAIEKAGFAPGQVALIVITHAHQDHTGSARELKQATGAKLAIQKNDAPFLSEGKSAEIVPASLLGQVIRLTTRVSPQAVAPVQPDILFEEELDLRTFGVNGKVISTPGHTAGSASVLLDSGKCLVGDLITAFAGRPGYPPFVQDKGVLRQSILKVIQAGATAIYPAHGGAFSVDLIRKWAE